MAITIVYALYHLLTLTSFPLPWFDETYFCSVADNLFETGNFTPTVAQTAKYGKEALTYGPVYFLITGSFIKLLGINALVFRLTALIAGFLCIWRFKGFLKVNQTSGYMVFIWVLLFAVDPFFTQGMHGGRMETVALFLALTTIGSYLTMPPTRNVRHMLILSLSASLAVMTTPRVTVILLPVSVMILADVAKKQMSMKDFFIYLAGPFVLMYGGWILYAFGDPGSFIEYYAKVEEGNQTAMKGFLGPNEYVPKQEYLLLGLTVIILIHQILINKSFFASKLIKISIGGIVFFHLLVFDWGPYSVLTLPFYYLIIFYALSSMKRWLSIGVIALLALHNLGYQGVKSIESMSTIDQRDTKYINAFVKSYIPEGANVVGPPRFYYAVKNAGADYQFYDKYNTLEKRFSLLDQEYGFEYLIIQNSDSDVSQYFLKNSYYKLLDTYSYANTATYKWLLRNGLTSGSQMNGYNCSIYKKVNLATNPL